MFVYVLEISILTYIQNCSRRFVPSFRENRRFETFVASQDHLRGLKMVCLHSENPRQISVFRVSSTFSNFPYLFQGPIVLSRDHHDVSGVDSPFRETSNIYDGSAFTAG